MLHWMVGVVVVVVVVVSVLMRVPLLKCYIYETLLASCTWFGTVQICFVKCYETHVQDR
jgi:hypothetical protein